MDLQPFKQDIDELISDFAEGGSTTLADMKTIWLLKKFSFIFEARPSTNQACFMQSLYAHSIGYMVTFASLSQRLGGLYCLYCLHETQPFKPPFKIYLSLGELRGLKSLVVDAKGKGIKVASFLVTSMLERNMFLFGSVDIKESSVEDRVNELINIQNACVEKAYKTLFASSRIEHFIHMDLGKELEADFLKKMSTDYAAAKKQAIKDASDVVDVQNIKHIAENKTLTGDVVGKTAEDWSTQKELFYQQTGYSRHSAEPSHQQEENQKFEQLEGNKKTDQNQEREDNQNFEGQEDDENFREIEELLSQAYYIGNEDGEDEELQQDD